MANLGQPHRGETPCTPCTQNTAPAEKNPRRDTAVPSAARAPQGRAPRRAGRPRRRSPTRATAPQGRTSPRGQGGEGVTRDGDGSRDNTAAEQIKRGHPQQTKTDGATIEEGHRRHDQSGSEPTRPTERNKLPSGAQAAASAQPAAAQCGRRAGATGAPRPHYRDDRAAWHRPRIDLGSPSDRHRVAIGSRPILCARIIGACAFRPRARGESPLFIGVLVD